MDIDDSQDKVRRNLLVFSCVIIAIAFLNIKIEKGTIFGLDVTMSSPGRIWLLFLFANIYFWQRYHFSEKTVQERDSTKNNFLKAVRDARLQLMTRQIKAAFAKKTLPLWMDGCMDGSGIKAAFTEKSAKNLFLRCTIEASEDFSSSLIHQIKFYRTVPIVISSVSYDWIGGSRSTSGFTSIFIEMEWKSYRSLLCKTSIRFIAHSKSMVDYLVPSILGAAAFLICLWHVGTAVIHRFF